MKKIMTITVLLCTVLLFFAACSLESGFDAKTLTDDQYSDDRDVMNQVANGAGGIGISTDTAVAGLLTSVDQIVEITFENGLIDEATLNAVSFWTLTAVETADGTVTRGTQLSPTSAVLHISGDSSLNATIVTYTFDLSSATTISDYIELFIDPTILTANNGVTGMDLDNDGYASEDNDDDYIEYFSIGTGTGGAPGVSVPVATAAGKNPRSSIEAKIGANATLAAVGNTVVSFDIDYSDTPLTNVPLTQAGLAAFYGIEKFNPATGAWAAQTYTAALPTTTANTKTFTMTLGTAVAAGEIYRVTKSSPYSFVETASVEGYIHRGSTDNNSATTSYGATFTIPGVLAGYNAAGPSSLAVNAVEGDLTSNAAAGDEKIAIELVFSGTFGTEGLSESTITPANIKLYDVDDEVYVTWVDYELYNSAIGVKNDKLYLILDPTYEMQGNDLEVQIGPGLTDLGDSTAVTDNVSLGDFDNTTTYPLGFWITTAVGEI